MQTHVIDIDIHTCNRQRQTKPSNRMETWTYAKDVRHTNSYTWVHRRRNIQIHTYIHPNPYLPASAGQAGVTPDLALEIVLAFAVPAQIDSAGLHMDVHQVVHDAALNVVLNSVHQEPTADINHLDEGQLPAGQEPTRLPSDPPQESPSGHS